MCTCRRSFGTCCAIVTMPRGRQLKCMMLNSCAAKYRAYIANCDSEPFLSVLSLVKIAKCALADGALALAVRL